MRVRDGWYGVGCVGKGYGCIGMCGVAMVGMGLVCVGTGLRFFWYVQVRDGWCMCTQRGVGTQVQCVAVCCSAVQLYVLGFASWG